MSQGRHWGSLREPSTWVLIVFIQTIAFTGSGCTEEAPSAMDLASRPPLSSPGTLSHEIALDLGNQVSLKMVLVPAGEFLMGDPKRLVGGPPSVPQHMVRISRPFYMGVYEITQEQYERLIGRNPSYLKGTERPVEQVTWFDAMSFCKKLSEATGQRIRLPTEAEWEYACRAGSTTLFHYGDDQKPNLRLGDYAWYEENSGHKAHRVGQKKPNGFGLYDVYGNVEEWCADWYALYQEGELTDPSGPTSGQTRILRGGNCGHPWDSCRSARRNNNVPHYSSDYVGFRVVLDPK